VPTVELHGVDIWYERVGTGPPCLVLHGGLGIDHTVYQATLAPLAAHWELVLPDHRGNGRSGRPPLESITVGQLADDAAALVGHLGFERVLVLGHSFGGFVAQELALRHPALVEGLVLVATTPGQLGTGERAEDSAGAPLPAEAAAILATPPRDDAELADVVRRILPYYLHRRPAEEVAPAFDGTVYDRDAMVRGFEALAGWSSVDRLTDLDVPTLLIVGRHDVFTSPPQSWRIASRVPDAELVVFDGSGHLPWVDEPERCVRLLLDWRAALTREGEEEAETPAP
jgi:proline iminopeptidase